MESLLTLETELLVLPGENLEGHLHVGGDGEAVLFYSLASDRPIEFSTGGYDSPRQDITLPYDEDFSLAACYNGDDGSLIDFTRFSATIELGPGKKVGHSLTVGYDVEDPVAAICEDHDNAAS